MADRFGCFADLEAEMMKGRDYHIEWLHRGGSEFLIAAPHGGKIEKGTTEVACAIAGPDLSFYSFEGCRNSGNRELHVTSHRFDEPNALNLAAKSWKIVGIHGRRDVGDRNTVYLGGLDNAAASTNFES